MKVLVAFEEREVRELVSFYLEGRFNMVAQQAASSKDAISALDVKGEEKPFDLLICDYNKDGKALMIHTVSRGITIQLLCTVATIPNDPLLEKRKDWVHFLQNTNLIEGLDMSIREYFKGILESSPSNEPEFCKIKPHLLLVTNPLKSNLYVRLSAIKFVMIMRSGVDFDANDFEYFCHKKKFENLYIKTESCREFALRIQADLVFKRGEAQRTTEGKKPAEPTASNSGDAKKTRPADATPQPTRVAKTQVAQSPETSKPKQTSETREVAKSVAEPKTQPTESVKQSSAKQTQEPIAAPKPTALAKQAPEPIAAPKPTALAKQAPEPIAAPKPTALAKQAPEPVAAPKPTVLAKQVPQPLAAPKPTELAKQAPEPIAAPKPTVLAKQAPEPVAPKPVVSAKPAASSLSEPKQQPLPGITPTKEALEEKKKRLDSLKSKAHDLETQKDKVLEDKKKESQEKQASLLAQAREQEAKRAALIESKKQEMLLQKKKAESELAAKAEKTLAARASNREQESAAKLKDEQAKNAALVKELEKDLGSEAESVHVLSQKLGFTKEVQEITKKNVLSTISTIRSVPKLSAILQQLRIEHDKYISSHSMLLAYISCALASQMEWSSDTTFQKMTMASFLHDVTLKNHDLATIQTLAELDSRKSKFTEEEWKEFREHPIAGADIARTFTEVPPDVDSIIAQHHERPDGSGFPRNLTHSRIGPLSTVFIVAHDLVCYLFKNEGQGGGQPQKI